MTFKPSAGFIPPWQDTVTLAMHLSCSPNTVENWVRDGILPPPRKRGAKLMWYWPEVNDWMMEGRQDGPPNDAKGARDAVRREREADNARH